jgi:hypothetical protein
LEGSLGVNRNWFVGKSEVMFLNPPPSNGLSATPILWEDLKSQYEKRISELEFIANLYRAEKIADPRYANFLQPNTEKGRVLPHPAMETGATCGVVANF